MKNKILQAGAVGLPIIATDMAIEGLNTELKKTIYLANTNEEFIDRIEEINNTTTFNLKSRILLQKNIIEKSNSIEIIREKIIKLKK